MGRKAPEVRNDGSGATLHEIIFPPPATDVTAMEYEKSVAYQIHCTDPIVKLPYPDNGSDDV